MKKLLAVVLSVAMLLTVGIVCASAVDETTFVPVGKKSIDWIPDIADRVEFDGDLSDWLALGDEITPYDLDQENFYPWTGTMYDTFDITVYFASDDTYLYGAYFVTDPDFIYGTLPTDSNATLQDYYVGDAFQMTIDFNSIWGTMQRETPELCEGQSLRGIYYSFSCMEDGAPLVFVTQRGSNERVMSEEADDFAGAAGATDTGWCAEFRMSWETLYMDMSDKSWAPAEVEFDSAHPIGLSMALCYIDRAHDDSGAIAITGGFGTFGTWNSGRNADDYSMTLELEWAEGRVLSSEKFTQAGDVGAPVETDPPADTNAAPADTNAAPADTNAAPADTNAAPADTNAAPADTNVAADTNAATDTNAAAGTNAPADDAAESGCASVVGAGAAVVVLSAVAAAVALKKKED